MLKFLRKYQLILLAVGGSLLMVVFLLQPVLNRLQPDRSKRIVATIGSDKEKITLGEQKRANVELDLLDRFLPEMSTLLGLDRENKTAHWLLLKHEAERMGVMGVQQDGEDWIPELAYGLVITQVELARRQGKQFTNDEVNETLRVATEGLMKRRESLMRSNRGLAPAAFNETMSKARGVMRLRRLHDQAPRMSEQQAIRAFEEMGTRILTDQVLLGPELLLGDIPEPSEAELAEQLEQYRLNKQGVTDPAEGGNQFGFGYLLPARIKLEWLTLDPRRVAEIVTPDPVLVRRRWQEQNPDGGSFEAARGEIEKEIKEETVEKIVGDADEIIRGEILAAQRGIGKEGIYRSLPEDWSPPDYEKIAQDVVEAIRDRHGVRITLPGVIRRTDVWLTQLQIQQLPGVGRAEFRVGNKRVRVTALPNMVRGVGEDSTVPVQIGLPIIEPVAEDADGAKYYITVLDARGESPPDGVGDIRDQLVRDVKSLKAFRALVDRIDEYRSVAVAGGLVAVSDLYRVDDETNPVRVRENIFVMRDGLSPASFTSFQDPRANDEAFRKAVLAAAADLDPLAEPDSMPLEQAVVVVPLPATRSVVLARIRAKVPPTVEDFRRFEEGLVSRETRRMISEAQHGVHPLQFSSIAERLDYVEIKRNGDTSDTKPDTTETADAG